ncbi:MAG: hypothetical protein Q9172_002910 [Xanthocarpia lactea]
MPPIPASSASRSKLQVFQFHGLPEASELKDPRHPKSQTSREAEKENQIPSDDHPAMASSQLLSRPPPLSQRSQHKDCPQTPIGRLPLAELIAGVDDNANQNLNLTPVERVLWQHVPGSSQFASSQDASVARTGKKRARSSSPTSSSQNETSNHFRNNKQSFDLQTLEKTLKTPQADPAADLWTRYSLKTGDIRDGSPTRNATVLADLLKSSSPQTPGSHLKQKELGGLRRAISCANEWPTSAAKRRKLNHTSSQNRALDDRPNVVPRDNARMSRVNLLVEQIENGLLKGRREGPEAKQSVCSSPPSGKHLSDCSSSPPSVPENHDDDEQDEEESDPTVVGGESAISELNESDMTFIAAETALLEAADRISDFGDDDFDEDLLEAVDASMAARQGTDIIPGRTTGTVVTAQPTGIAKQILSNAIPKPLVNVGQDRKETKPGFTPAFHTKTNTVNAPAAITSAVSEDFDDDDNDMSAADLEDLVAVFDKQSPNPRKRIYPSQPQQASVRKAVKEPNMSQAPSARLEPHKIPGISDVIDVSSDEEYGEGFDFDDLVVNCTEQTQISSQNTSRYTIQRYRVIQVAEGGYTSDKGYSRPQKVSNPIFMPSMVFANGLKVLVVQPEKTKSNKVIVLRQSWVRSPCSADSFVHLIGEFDHRGQCIVDDHDNMLILHPDHLVSATVVGDSFSCTRRAVLQDRVKATNDASEAQVYGHVLHEIFQEAMKANRWDDEWLHNRIEVIASRYLESFFEINLDPILAIDQLKSKSTALQSWAEIFVSAKPKAAAIIKDRNGALSTVSVNKLLEVEEKVWSPMYGLKGNVDASVQITINDKSGDRTLTVPFELKTGKQSNAAHKAQTALYTLLLSDRYGMCLGPF